MRAKKLQVEGVAAHAYNAAIRQGQNEYAAARRAGLQPASPFKKDVADAWAITEATGKPFRADK